ncbi:MAG TPA: SH3 domain-containing protein [Myxococcaceae bacterium]|nr:SH3 domain-containing protein [Myxococcaceae bacterium]
MRQAAVVLALVLVTGAAWGLAPGDRAYIRGRDVAVLQSTTPGAATVVKLQPGDTVIWRGADRAKPSWHRVDARGKSGVVYFANLSATPPGSELVNTPAGVKKLDAQAFASSGAAGKALTEGAVRYGDQPEKNQGALRPTMKEAVRQTETLEAISAQRTTAELDAQAARISGAQQ